RVWSSVVSSSDLYYCKIANTPTKCTKPISYGLLPNNRPNLLSGAFGQYVHIKKNTSFFKTNLAPDIAILTEPFSMAVHEFERANGIPFGGTVLVQGVGAIGLGAIAFAKLSGASKIIAVGAPQKRLEIAKEFGADVTVNIEEVTDPTQRMNMVKKETVGNR